MDYLLHGVKGLRKAVSIGCNEVRRFAELDAKIVGPVPKNDICVLIGAYSRL